MNTEIKILHKYKKWNPDIKKRLWFLPLIVIEIFREILIKTKTICPLSWLELHRLATPSTDKNWSHQYSHIVIIGLESDTTTMENWHQVLNLNILICCATAIHKGGKCTSQGTWTKIFYYNSRIHYWSKLEMMQTHQQ